MALLERFFPDIYVKSVFELPLEDLKKLGIRGLVFDIDNTVAPFSIRSKRDKRIALYSNRNLCLRFCDYLIVTENLRPVGRNAL